MAEITVDISRNAQNGTLKIKWSRACNSFRPYFIKQPLVDLLGKKVRTAMQVLIDAGRDGRTTEYGLLVRRLAKEGRELYDALFFGATPDDIPNATMIQEWVKRRVARQDRITFIVGSRIHAPWGLIYDDEVADEVPGKQFDAEDFKSFWAVKYAAVTHYFDIPPLGIDAPWPVQQFRILFGAHKELWEAACASLDNAEKINLRNLLLDPEQPKHTLNDLIAAWVAS